MSVKDISLRPLRSEDVEQLELFRREYQSAEQISFDVPFGYSGQGIETAVTEKNGQIVGALTASSAVTFDFFHDAAMSGPDIFAAVLLLERALALVAQKAGISTAYVAIPNHLTKYVDMVKRCGYEEALQACTILRRPLRQELSTRDANAAK